MLPQSKGVSAHESMRDAGNRARIDRKTYPTRPVGCNQDTGQTMLKRLRLRVGKIQSRTQHLKTTYLLSDALAGRKVEHSTIGAHNIQTSDQRDIE